MSGRHARIFSAIWQDDDFRSLTAGPQRLYLFLLSQPNVTHLGVLPLTYRRWVKACRDYSVDELVDDLRVLAEERYVVVDDDTEELLIRSLLRRDGVFKQPNVLLAAINSADGIGSTAIKQVLVSEVDRINVDEEIRDDAKGSAEGKRAVAREGLQRLRKALGDTPWNPSPNPSRGVPDGSQEPSTCAGAPARRAQPLPLPLPVSPTPSPTTLARSEPSAFDAWYALYPRKSGKDDAIKAYARAAKKVGHDVLLAGVRRMAADPNLPEDKQFIPYPATWLNRGQWEDEPYPPRIDNRARPSTRDAAVAQVGPAFAGLKAAQAHTGEIA